MDRLNLENTVAIRTLPQAKCPKSLLCEKRYKKTRAQTTVEFSLIVLPFFAILFALIDYAQIYFYKNSLQNALRESTRFATAGRIIQMYDGMGNPMYETNNGVAVPRAINGSYGEASRNECIRWWFLSNCVIQIPMTNITITSASTLPGDPPNVSPDGSRLYLTNGPSEDGGANPGPGAANDYIQVTAIYHLHTITPLFGYLGGYSRQDGINSYRVVVTAIVKNEPALLNFQHTNVYSGEYGPLQFP